MKRSWLLVVLATILASVWLLQLVDRPVRDTWLPKLALVGVVLILGILGFSFETVRAWFFWDSLVDDTDASGITDSGVGMFALVGGLVFVVLGVTLYFVGSLTGPAALPVVVIGGCFTLAGLVAVLPRRKGGAGASNHEDTPAPQ